MSAPYFTDGTVTLYHGRLEDVLPTLGIRPDLVVADPPYAETSLAWDRWPPGWPGVVAGYASSMWCFGSMRMFLDRRDEFIDWRLSQDVVWRKPTTSFNPGDRLNRVHEHALHWYRGPWGSVHHVPDRVPAVRRRPGDHIPRRAIAVGVQGAKGAAYQQSDGLAYRTSVIDAAGLRGTSNPTEKPQGLLEPLITYGCPPGGLVLDPFAGSCSTLVAARALGRRAVGIEMREEQCEQAARRLAQDVLPLEAL